MNHAICVREITRSQKYETRPTHVVLMTTFFLFFACSLNNDSICSSSFHSSRDAQHDFAVAIISVAEHELHKSDLNEWQSGKKLLFKMEQLL